MSGGTTSVRRPCYCEQEGVVFCMICVMVGRFRIYVCEDCLRILNLERVMIP